MERKRLKIPIVLTNCLQQVQMKKKKSLNWIRIQGEDWNLRRLHVLVYLLLAKLHDNFQEISISLSEDMEGEIQHVKLCQIWKVSYWNPLTIARNLFGHGNSLWREKWFKTINQLFETGDLYWAAGLFAALPVLPFQNELIPGAIDGLRTNNLGGFLMQSPWIILFHPRIFPEQIGIRWVLESNF